jgi:hypothetical protein
MDCGADLAEAAGLAARLDDAIRVKQPVAAQAAPRVGAAARGMAAVGESSDATRLRIFDRHEAEKLRAERVTAFATAGIALILCVVFGVVAMNRFEAADGMAGVKELTMGSLRGWDAFTNKAIAAIWFAGASLGSLLCVVGQVVRGLKASKAIALVAANKKPEIVGISVATQIGMLIYAVICPPFGIIVGIIMKLSKDENTSALGGMVLLFGFGALIVLVGNWLWGLGEAAAAKRRPAPKVEEGAALWWMLLPLWAPVAARLRSARQRGA